VTLEEAEVENDKDHNCRGDNQQLRAKSPGERPNNQIDTPDQDSEVYQRAGDIGFIGLNVGGIE